MTVGETKSSDVLKPKSGLAHITSSKKPDTAGSIGQTNTPKSLASKKSDVNTSCDNLNVSTGSGNNESQMFKELFNTNKNGIAGINNVPSSDEGVNRNSPPIGEEAPHHSTKSLNKVSSKKNLKNKF